MTTVLLSANEVLEELAIQASSLEDLEEVYQNLSLFVLQLRSELARHDGVE